MKIIRKLVNRIRRKRYIPLPYERISDYYADGESEKNGKYKIAHTALGLKEKLPFEPTTCEVVYIENEYDEKVNRCIRDNIDFIRECFAKRGFVFVYLPLLEEELKGNDDFWHYRCPYADKVDRYDVPPISSNFLLYFMANPQNRRNIRPSFARYNYNQNYFHWWGGQR